MAGIMADLGVAGSLALKAIGRRMRGEIEPAPDLEAFNRGMQGLIEKGTTAGVRDYRWVSIAATRPPWVDSGLDLAEGDEVTYFVDGRVYANRLLDIYVNPALQLWCKVGDGGQVFRGTRNSHSFRAEHGGRLMFGNYFPNDWSDPSGARLQPDDIYSDVSGELRVLVVRWQHSADQGLRDLLDAGDPGERVSGEIDRIAGGDTTPDGWHYLWHLGPAEIYRRVENSGDSACIHCSTHADVGILQRDVDLPLDESSTISWRWCVRQLPSTLREDTVPSHDYLSLAVEFDDGKDITYYWSRSLPVGAGYECPLPNWKHREFHVVVRSGEAGLGTWCEEQRNLYADYAHYMGVPPRRIVRVWLIANSIFQRGHGDCDYADIQLSNCRETVRVL